MVQDASWGGRAPMTRWRDYVSQLAWEHLRRAGGVGWRVHGPHAEKQLVSGFW